MEDNPMQAWTMFQHYMAAKIEDAKNVHVYGNVAAPSTMP
jgi:hypothetical protein